MGNINKMEAERLFSIIQREKGNDRCFDCRRGGPTWVSMQHAVFVCIRCAANHRAIGLRLKSVLLDTFKEEDFKRIKLGGNFACDEEGFDRKYKCLADLPGKLDRLVASSTDEPFDLPGEDELSKLVVKQQMVPKFGKKVSPAERRASEAVQAGKKEVPSTRSVPIERKELMVSRKEYRVGDISINRMGFGISKIKKTDKSAE